MTRSDCYVITPHVEIGLADSCTNGAAAELDRIAASSHETKALHEQLKLLFREFTTRSTHRPEQSSFVIQFAELLKKLERRLEIQFWLEETLGYFRETVDLAPEWSARVDALLADHDKLMIEITYLAERAQAMLCQPERGNDLQNLVTRARTFCARYERHEQRENELLLQTYNEDVGVGD